MHDRGGTPFRELVNSIPDELARLGEFGIRLEFVTPSEPPEHARRLLETLGVLVTVDPRCSLGPAVRIARR